MLASEIIALAQDWTYSTDSQYPASTKWIRDINILYKELVSEINQDVNNDLFTETYFSDIIAGQSEYSKPQVSNTTPQTGMTNLLNVAVNYDIPALQTGTITLAAWNITWTWTTFTTNLMAWQFIIAWTTFMAIVKINSDTSMLVNVLNNWPTWFTGATFYSQLNKYVKLRSERASNLEKDKLWYQYNQPETHPFYIMFDTGIEIYPIKNTNIQFWLKIAATKDAYDLALTDTPIIDDNWHYVMALGLRQYIFMQKWQHAEAQNARTEYQQEIERMKNTISDVQVEPFTRFTPNLPEFQ